MSLDEPIHTSIVYKCTCSICGKIKHTKGANLSRNSVQSCGCAKSLKPKRQDYTGCEIKGTLVLGYIKSGIWRFHHKICGHTSEDFIYVAKKAKGEPGYCPACRSWMSWSNRNKSHGKCSTRTYKIWAQMRQRTSPGRQLIGSCYEQGSVACFEEWSTFEAFHRDMGDCPPGMTLDRINNKEGYKASNCRWASRKTQRLNTISAWKLRIYGRWMSLPDACDLFGKKYSSVCLNIRNNENAVRDIFGPSLTDYRKPYEDYSDICHLLITD
jgi:hypothetical protein